MNKLIVFVKNQEAGKVKTRLAASVGDEKALEVYRDLLSYTFSITRALDADKEVWYSRFIPEEDDLWSESSFRKRKQEGADLGERMSGAFRVSLEKEGCQKTVLIGSDCSELKSGIIEDAFQALDDQELVLGPAADGGYYLVGLRTYRPEIFDGIEWSTDSVLKQTLEKAKANNIKWALLPELNDVDTIEDWNLVKERLSSHNDQHHHTDI